MEKNTPSTPPRKTNLGLGDAGESPASIIARLMQENAQQRVELADRDAALAEERRALAEERRALAEERRAHAEERRALEEERRKKDKTKLLDYLGLVGHIYQQFTVETDRSQLAQGTTSVAGKFCPRRLRLWPEFGALHDQKLQLLQDTLDPLPACFASPNDVSGLLSAFSPRSKTEVTLRPFLRVALEKPAAAVVNAYLSAVSETPEGGKTRHVHFADDDTKAQSSSSLASRSAFTPEPTVSAASSGTAAAGIPDRVCMYDAAEKNKLKVRFLVKEHKAAHRLPAAKLEHMMANPPENFFLQAAGLDTSVPVEDADNDAVFSKKYPRVYLAKAMCQAYHYMISGALEYGCIATGFGLLLLHVLPNDLDTLYCHCVTFATGAQSDILPPQNTAAAYMATLVLLALRDTAPTAEEIAVWAQDRLVWPTVKYKGKKGDPKRDRDDSSHGGGAENNSDVEDGGARGGAKRTRTGPSALVLSPKKPGGDAGGGNKTAAADRLPVACHLRFCTQACLLGVVNQLPLDEKCPNVALHRAASLRMHGQLDGHPLTADGVREALRAQAEAAKSDPTLGCYPCGRAGRYGTMMRVAVTVAGYCMVAKATYPDNVGELEHEQHVYQALRAYQGKLIPVSFGVMTFLSNEFTCDYMLRAMLFLSYAGRDLGRPDRLPLNVDLQTAMDQTVRELYDAGLRDRDVRPYNCAWNLETQRVLCFDFDQATMAAWGRGDWLKKEVEDVGEASDSVSDRTLVTRLDEETLSQLDIGKTPRSILLKRTLSTLGNTATDGVQTKRPRAGSV